jgi:hypothetical protein
VVQQLPPNFLVWKTYGNFQVSWRMDQTPVTCRLTPGDLSIFFFFMTSIWAGKIFEFLPKRFRDAWLFRGAVSHLMRRIV